MFAKITRIDNYKKRLTSGKTIRLQATNLFNRRSDSQLLPICNLSEN